MTGFITILLLNGHLATDGSIYGSFEKGLDDTYYHE